MVPWTRDLGEGKARALLQAFGPMGLGRRRLSPSALAPSRSGAYLFAGTQAAVAARHQLPVQEADQRVLRTGDRRRRRREQNLQARHACPQLLRAEEGSEKVR